jgi:hypothetical protein
MTRFCFTIASLLGLVLLVAVSFAALREATSDARATCPLMTQADDSP